MELYSSTEFKNMLGRYKKRRNYEKVGSNPTQKRRFSIDTKFNQIQNQRLSRTMETLLINRVKKIREEAFKPYPKAMFFNKHEVQSKIQKQWKLYSSTELRKYARKVQQTTKFRRGFCKPSQKRCFSFDAKFNSRFKINDSPE